MRADDRDGARAYLLKGENWDLNFSGNFIPGLNSADNEARRGMDSLPWMAALGPQLIIKLSPDFEFKADLFQAVSTDLASAKTNGLLGELILEWEWSHSISLSAAEPLFSQGHIDINFSLQTASFFQLTSMCPTRRQMQTVLFMHLGAAL